MNRFSWKWYLKDIVNDKPVKVFSTFSCGGGSTMGYKRAGFKVLGNVEIDPKINEMYVKNQHPEFNYNMDLRQFNEMEVPEELKDLDILDGSPPCTTFSMAGDREQNWGKAKKFREGQSEQTLDDLFFVFLDTVEKLKPKVVIAENVVGLITGKARGYVNQIIKRFHEVGYDVQLFRLNAARMDVPQARERVFFIANRCGFKPLKLDFCYDAIPFGNVKTEKGTEIQDGVLKTALNNASQADRKVEHTVRRISGQAGSYFTIMYVSDKRVAPTLTAGGMMLRLSDKTKLSDGDIVNLSTFPQDYDFNGNGVQYVCGMSVPPNMMANIATEVWEQWFR